MAAIKKEKTDEKRTANSVLDKILKETKDTHFNFQERVDWKVSTGSLLIDAATGGVRPSLIRLAGPPGSGKSAQSLEILRNFLHDVPNSRAVWFLAEGRGLSDEHIERCGLKFVYDSAEWAEGTVFVFETNIFETFVRTVKDLVKQNEDGSVFAFVVDSVDGLILESDSKKEINENAKVAGVPGLSKKMLQSLSLGMFKFGHLMIMLSQQTADIKIDPYAPSAGRMGKFAGGNALSHAADLILEYSHSFAGDFILDKPDAKITDKGVKTLGKMVKVTFQKVMKEKARKTTISYPVKFGKKPSGIWTEYEVGDLILMWNMVEKSGSWLTLGKELREICDPILVEDGKEPVDKIQGQNRLFAFLEENPRVCQTLYEKFREMIG